MVHRRGGLRGRQFARRATHYLGWIENGGSIPANDAHVADGKSICWMDIARWSIEEKR